ALLVYRQRVQANLQRMLAIASGAERLRPHIKTCKMREVVDMQLALGISKFKCATIAEAEMAASAGVPDLLLAYQPVGPGARRAVELVRRFPKTRFSVTCDDAGAIRGLSAAFTAQSSEQQSWVEVLLDIDVGQHRTGVPAGPGALELCHLIGSLPGLKP